MSMSETIIKTALEELVRKHQLAVEELTEQQLAEAICQAIACGDFQRHVAKRRTLDPGATDPQCVLYIPFAREQELEAELESLRKRVDGLPADWTKDSSLETWFPFTAQELKRYRDALAQIAEFKLGGVYLSVSHVAKKALQPCPPKE